MRRTTGALASAKGKRDKKTQALNALLFASALGLLLEGCGGTGDNAANGELLLVATVELDTHTGGADEDTVSYANSGAPVRVNLSKGLGVGGYAEGDTFESIENLIGSDYDDFLVGEDNSNTFKGEGGDDTLNGGAGNDYLYGGAGNDTLNGGAGNDLLRGETGDDTLNGGGGDDTFRGETGDDTLNGGGGKDTYHFRKYDGGTDTIYDVAGDAMDLVFFGYENDDFKLSSLARRGDDLHIDLGGDKIRIVNAYDDDPATGTGNTAFTINVQYSDADGQLFDVAGVEVAYTL